MSENSKPYQKSEAVIPERRNAASKNCPTSLQRVFQAVRITEPTRAPNVQAAPDHQERIGPQKYQQYRPRFPNKTEFGKMLAASWKKRPENYGAPNGPPIAITRVTEKGDGTLTFYHLEAYARHTGIPIGLLLLLSRLISAAPFAGDDTLPDLEQRQREVRGSVRAFAALVEAYNAKIESKDVLDMQDVCDLLEVLRRAMKD